MTDHVTPEEARPYELATWRADSWRWFANREPQQRILTVEECNILARETEMFARQFRSLAAQLEAAQAQLREAQEMAWEACGERDAAQEVIEAAMEAKTWEACYEILERARYDAAREA